MQGYKDKSKDIICLCIIQAVRIRAIGNAMYHHLKDDRDAENDYGTSNNNNNKNNNNSKRQILKYAVVVPD